MGRRNYSLCPTGLEIVSRFSGCLRIISVLSVTQKLGFHLWYDAEAD